MWPTNIPSEDLGKDDCCSAINNTSIKTLVLVHQHHHHQPPQQRCHSQKVGTTTKESTSDSSSTATRTFLFHWQKRLSTDSPYLIQIRPSTRRRSPPTLSIALIIMGMYASLLLLAPFAAAWNPTDVPKSNSLFLTVDPARTNSGHYSYSYYKTTSLWAAAKRNKNRPDEDDLNRWYDDVDADATPDKVFWEEMERQRLLNQVNDGSDDLQQPSMASMAAAEISSSSTSLLNPQNYNVVPPPMSGFGGVYARGSTVASSSSSMGSFSSNINIGMNVATGSSSSSSSSSYATSRTNMGGSSNFDIPSQQKFPTWRQPVPTMEQIKMAEATLAQYELFQVADNWIDEELQMEADKMKTTPTVEEDADEPKNGDRQASSSGTTNSGFASVNDSDSFTNGQNSQLSPEDLLPLMDDEPWDVYSTMNGDPRMGDDKDRQNNNNNNNNVLKVPFPPKDSKFYFDPTRGVDRDMQDKCEAELADRMKSCQMRSHRLEKAQKSPKAKAFFARPPNAKEGFEHRWVAAVDNAFFMPFKGNLREYGVEFADNFGDFVDRSAYDGLYTVDDMAAWKARQVYKVTGLPVIASRTGFEVEPVPASSLTNFKDSLSGPVNRAAASTRISNPKVLTGYKINDVGMHVDYLTEALRPLSEPTRKTRFTTCLCFYDGEMEIKEYGVCDVDMYYCNSMRTFIPLSQAMNNMVQTLKFTFSLEYQKFLKTRVDDAIYGASTPGNASMKLRDRVLKDGKVLPNDIIDVSKFMDSQVDVNLMDECAQELSQRFIRQKPTKIMTVATTGLVIALPMAKYLQVPVVYARKERNVVMADTYAAAYSSKTVGKNQQLLVSKSHLHEDDRVLVIDDFLSSGSSQEALLRIIYEAGAEAVGVGVLLEKVYDSGRQSLSGFDIPIQSLCRVASVENGVIQLVEEEGFDKMKEQ